MIKIKTEIGTIETHKHSFQISVLVRPIFSSKYEIYSCVQYQGASLYVKGFMTLREKCPNTELFLVRIQYEYRKIRTRNNSIFGHFSRSVTDLQDKLSSK